MPDAQTLRDWFEQWRRENADRWVILRDLAGLDEATRRNVLRPHEQAESHTNPPPPIQVGSGPKKVGVLRRELDEALDALTFLEIGFQVNALPTVLSDPSDAGWPIPELDSFIALTRSEAFLRYLDVYLFFGVRFFAARIRAAKILEQRRTGNEEELPLVNSQTNIPGKLVVTAPTLESTPPGLLDALQQMVATRTDAEEVALSFLDGFRQKRDAENAEAEDKEPLRGSDKAHEPNLFELWLRGLLPELDGGGWVENAGGLNNPCISPGEVWPAEGKRFHIIAEGIESWARRRARLYLSLRDPDTPQEPATGSGSPATPPSLPDEELLWRGRPKEGWRCDTPVNARLVLADLYWLAGLLRVDVNPHGVVTYQKVSWLGLLRARAALHCDKVKESQLQAIEEVLRLVFSITCELVQNAAELRDEQDQREANPDGPHSRRGPDTRKWRTVFDCEMHAIERQRALRNYHNPPGTNPSPPPLREDSEVWSERLTTGEHQRDLIGLAFSGGGIRSATFNLGVLQGLQELDLLRQIDYLSTVSGGGYIGAWLVGNVRRARYWLGSLAPWEQSLRHLRAYSNYLAPRTGILSMDTWSLGGLWVRNTLLIQLTAFAWLLAAMTGVYAMRLSFLGFVYRGSALSSQTAWYAFAPAQLIAMLMGSCVLSMMLLSFVPRRPKIPRIDALLEKQRWQAMLPALAGSAFVLLQALRFAVQKRGLISAALHDVLHLQSGALFRLMVPTAAILAPLGIVGFILSKGIPRKLEHLSTSYWIRWLAVVPAFLGSAIVGANLFAVSVAGLPAANSFFARANGYAHARDFSTIFLRVGWRPGIWMPALVLSAAAFFLLGLFALSSAARERNAARGGGKLNAKQRWFGLLGAVWICAACTLVVYLGFCTIVFAALRLQPRLAHTQPGMDNIGFLATPALVMLSYALAILLMIGLSGRYSNEPQREWWTRLGGWIFVSALLGVLIPGAVLGGPWLMHHVFAPGGQHTLAWGSVATWLGTVISGLFAGKSSKTSDGSASKAPSLEVLSKVAGLLFLVGASLLSAQILFLFLQGLLDKAPPGVSMSLSETPWTHLFFTGAALLICGLIFSLFFDINIFGLNQLYRNRLVRCFLGATRWRPGMRSPEPFTRFDFEDDLKLNDLGPWSKAFDEFRGPIPLVNCTLNLGGSGDLALHTRHSDSFTLSPLFCGSDRPSVGYALTGQLTEQISLGQAVSISGAAASPNMGYNTSPLVAFLLTMFNVRLGWWIANPGRTSWSSSLPRLSLTYLLQELAGEAKESRKFVNLSDGGHFENLGIYELVRRGCKVILVGDAECDEEMEFGGLANAVRLCATDFGAVIDMDVSSLRRQPDKDSLQHAAVGTIKYSNGSIGRIIYLKASISGDEDISVKQYRSSFPSFPHQSTSDQFFSEDQFESYRRLGLHVVQQSFRGVAPGEFLVPTSEQLADVLTPAFASTETFLRHSGDLNLMWERLRSMLPPDVADAFFSEVMGLASATVAPALTQEVTYAGLELLQLMENVFADLRLDDFWEHPDNRGWAVLFMNWARSPRLRLIWKGNHRTLGMRFEYFCNRRLGLYRDDPVMRVVPLAQG